MVVLVVLGLLLDSMILRVFSNLNDSMILWFVNTLTREDMIPMGSKETSDLVISLHHKAWFHSRSRTFLFIKSLPTLNQDHRYFNKKKSAFWFLFLFILTEVLAQVSVQTGFLLASCILDYLNFVALHRGKWRTEYAFQAFCCLWWYSNQKEYHLIFSDLKLHLQKLHLKITTNAQCLLI